jgi:hypothetical protein
LFPIDPDHAAQLLVGELQYVVELRIERRLQELDAVGLEARHVLPEEGSDGALPNDFIRWVGRIGPGTVHAGALEQLGVELMDPTAWANGLARCLLPPGAERRWGIYVCFARENEVWR